MCTLEKVKQHIKDGIEENIHLDYKGAGFITKSGEKKKEISKAKHKRRISLTNHNTNLSKQLKTTFNTYKTP